MNNKTRSADLPAFPPQIVLDQFNRAIAPAPGFSKLEAVALHILPHYLEIAKANFLLKDGVKVSPIESAYATAELFCAHYDRLREAAEASPAIVDAEILRSV